MRKFVSLIVCLFLIGALATSLGCKKGEETPVPEEKVISWMSAEGESQGMGSQKQVGEEGEQEITLPEELEEPSWEEEYEEEQGEEPYPDEPSSEELEEF